MASSTSALPAGSAAVPPLSKKPDPAKTTNAAAPITPQRQLQLTGAIAAGFAVLSLGVSAGVNMISGSAFGLLLSFAGVLAGVNAIAYGFWIARDAAPVGRPAVFAGAGALPAFLRRELAVVGLLVASSAVAAVAGETGARVSFVMFLLLLLGVAQINAGVHGAY
ncbi:unnamed protein product [Urochloa humidicola]